MQELKAYGRFGEDTGKLSYELRDREVVKTRAERSIVKFDVGIDPSLKSDPTKVGRFECELIGGDGNISGRAVFAELQGFLTGI